MFNLEGINNPQKTDRVIKAFLRDKEGKQLCNQMVGADVSLSILQIIDFGTKYESQVIDIEENYYTHHTILKNNPGKFIVFAGVHPDRGDRGYGLFKKAIKEYGFSGMKLYPPLGYKLMDHTLQQYYTYCIRNKLSVLVHTGPAIGPDYDYRQELCDIKALASSFPELVIILAHAGYRMDIEMHDIALHNKNIYLDIAGFQSLDNQQLYNNLIPVFSEALNSKVLFGSDWPIFNLMNPLSANIKRLARLVTDNNIPQERLDNILFRNAQGILH
jgi:predicted TIM-barrel fold metal-dependent hydrolase